MVSIQAYARAGSTSDTDETSGLASLATEMMGKGTKKLHRQTDCRVLRQYRRHIPIEQPTELQFLAMLGFEG